MYLEFDSKLFNFYNREESFPPFDVIFLGDDNYRLDIAVAGYTDIDIEEKDNILTVSGNPIKRDGWVYNEFGEGFPDRKDKTKYINEGIKKSRWTKRFNLIDHIKVGKATLTDGILKIGLYKEVPESEKPRKIAIHRD